MYCNSVLLKFSNNARHLRDEINDSDVGIQVLIVNDKDIKLIKLTELIAMVKNLIMASILQSFISRKSALHCVCCCGMRSSP